MTREEAIKQLESLLAHCESMRSDDDLIWGDDCDALKIALSALRPVSREQVEKVWRSEWGKDVPLGYRCKSCVCLVVGQTNFCPACGAPMTDKAMQMVMARLEALKDGD